MANPINPQTGHPWSDQELAYFRLLDQNKSDPTFADRSAAYLTTVAKPNPQTGAPMMVQGADPYQVSGGFQEVMDAAQRDVWRQQADLARKQLDFQKGSATGWVDGRATEEEQKRQDDIRRNPMNAALYEQERRGYRSGTGNEDPLMYQKLEGDKAFQSPGSLPATQPSGGGGASGGGGGGGSGSGGSSAPASGGPAPVAMQSNAPRRAAAQATEAFFNPRTNQYEFTTTAGAPRFSIDRGTGTDLSGANAWQGTKGTGDDTVATPTQNVDKASMSKAVADLNKRIGSLTPEAAAAFAKYDASKGLMGGGEVEVAGYEDGAYGFATAQQARDFAAAMADPYKQYTQEVGARLGSPAGAQPPPEAAAQIQKRFQDSLLRAAEIRDTARSIQNAKGAGMGNEEFQKSPDWRAKLGRVQQLLNYDLPGTDKDLTDPNLDNAYWGRRNDQVDNMLQRVMEMQTGDTPDNNVGNVIASYNPDWYQQRYNPAYDWEKPMPFKQGGGMVLGGAPHWIVDPMGKPVAALTEDGKKEQVKGKGGVEVVPLDPARKAAYEARKKGVPGKAAGGPIQMRASRTRPGAAAGNSEATLSGKTTQSKEVNARRKGAGAGDGRATNGRTNNGRPGMPGADIGRGDVTDKDAASVRGIVAGDQRQGNRPRPTPVPTGPGDQQLPGGGKVIRTPWGDMNIPANSPWMQRRRPDPNSPQAQALMDKIRTSLPAQFGGGIKAPVARVGGNIGVPGGETVAPVAPPMSIPGGETVKPVTQGPMGAGVSTMPVREPNGAVMPYRATMGGGVAPVFQMPRGPIGGFNFGGVAGMAEGDVPTDAYGGLGGASNAFVAAGKGTHQDFMNIMLHGGSNRTTTTQSTNSVNNFVNGQPVAALPTTPALAAPKPLLPAPAGGFDASGGPRIIGNETAPTARYGFDKNAPIDVAAHGATRGVKGMPGVQVAQPWKQAPRSILTRGQFGNQLLQSYWNATGAAPEDLADRGRAAAPGQAGSNHAFV